MTSAYQTLPFYAHRAGVGFEVEGAPGRGLPPITISGLWKKKEKKKHIKLLKSHQTNECGIWFRKTNETKSKKFDRG